MLVESEPSSATSSSTHSDSQVPSVALPSTVQEEQVILKDFVASILIVILTLTTISRIHE